MDKTNCTGCVHQGCGIFDEHGCIQKETEESQHEDYMKKIRNESCKVDLDKCDEYEEYVIPDEDCEIALKVIRTIRNCYCGGPMGMDGGVAVLLSRAHSCISDCIRSQQTDEIGEQ